VSACSRLAFLALAAGVLGCGNLRSQLEPPDGGGLDGGGARDAGVDAGGTDAGPVDSGQSDGGNGSCDSTTCPTGCCAGTTCVVYHDQTGAQCGWDGGACGVCASGSTCLPYTACTLGFATMAWEVDGVLVGDSGTYETAYTVSTDSNYLFLPGGGRNLEIFFENVSDSGTVTRSCPWPFSSPSTMLLTTTSNSLGAMNATLPVVWKGLSYSNCNASGNSDQVTRYDLSATLTPSRMTGSFDIFIDGGGPQSGSTLHVFGDFDVYPPPM